jgi:hypothetical protein
MERRFYDIHYHLFDLSHPNLLAFLLRDDLITRGFVKRFILKFPFLLQVLPLWVVTIFAGKAVKKIREHINSGTGNFRNLLSVVESAIEYHFLYTEFLLLQGKSYFGDFEGAKYNKIVICPLLMDFGYKNLNNPDCFYNLPPAKPIVNQVVDLINAIRFYYNYELILHPVKSGRLKIVPTSKPKEKKLFEIYPFLGINTQNYDLEEIVGLFDKYFGGYEADTDPESRRTKLFARLGMVKADLEDLIFRRREKTDSGYYRYLFAGIKLYPPIGFDPWPEEDSKELEKVKFLYSECIRKRLPLTVHCSDGGYITSSEATKLTDPDGKWKQVISRSEYKDLKINFAHLGNQHDGKQEWLTAILRYISEKENIYTDCAFQTPLEKDYERVKSIMNESSEKGILFGSDFVINLIWSESYNAYLTNFIKTASLSDRQKELMCEINPARFLFG